MDREELKLKLINELIDKGLSDDQILEIVEKHFPLDVVAAPAPSTSVTPQQALNRTVAAIKKVKDIKADASIKVIDANGDDTKTLGTLDETNAQNKLMTVGYTNVKLEARVPKTGVAFYKGEMVSFNMPQTAPSKFADTNLFDLDETADINAKALITQHRTSRGELHVRKDEVGLYRWSDITVNTSGPITLTDDEIAIKLSLHWDGRDGMLNNCIINDYDTIVNFGATDDGHGSAWTWDSAKRTLTHKDGYNANYQKLVKQETLPSTYRFVYTAKKNITHEDMGE